MGDGRRKCVRKPAEEEREMEEADKVEVAPGVTAFGCKCEIVAIRGGIDGSRLAIYQTLSINSII